MMNAQSGKLLNLVSRGTGILADLTWPSGVVQEAKRWFVDRYNIDMSEAEHPIDTYKSVGELFTRKLKPGLRPLGTGVVHPCDGFLSKVQPIQNDVLVQAKSHSFSLQDMLVDQNALSTFQGGVSLTYYLCPTDYHRVHSPLDCEIESVTHVPGALWPVNNWAVDTVPGLFAINERVVFRGRSGNVPFALVMVGATNVGKITVSFDTEIKTNVRKKPFNYHAKTYLQPVTVNKGGELGIFNMGSTVILVFPVGVVNKMPSVGPVKLGVSLTM
jgi:phosphatidylserine decarboxylase